MIRRRELKKIPAIVAPRQFFQAPNRRNKSNFISTAHSQKSKADFSFLLSEALLSNSNFSLLVLRDVISPKQCILLLRSDLGCEKIFPVASSAGERSQGPRLLFV